MPHISDISPKVALINNNMKIKLKGQHFNPSLIIALWIGKFKTPYTFIDENTIEFGSPVISDSDDFSLEVRIEAIIPGGYSNEK